jgi:hypothetical protein
MSRLTVTSRKLPWARLSIQATCLTVTRMYILRPHDYFVVTRPSRYYNPPPQRIIRKVPGNGPVEDLSLIE